MNQQESNDDDLVLIILHHLVCDLNYFLNHAGHLLLYQC